MNRKPSSLLSFPQSGFNAAILGSCLLLMAGCSDQNDSDTNAPASSNTTSTLNRGDEPTTKDVVLAEVSADNASGAVISNQNDENSTAKTFETIEWETLIHPDDLQALLNPPEYLANIEDGSFEDQISNGIRGAIEQANDDPYQQALVSTRVVSDMDGKGIRLPGFIVPLEFNDNQVITQFFLVPFFGACIHVPPPPPNQIILVNAPQGLVIEALYDPFWVSGTLHTTLTENDVATSAYSLDMDSFEPYSDL